MSASKPHASSKKLSARLQHPLIVSYFRLKRLLRSLLARRARAKTLAITLAVLVMVQAGLMIVVPVTASRKKVEVVTGGEKAVMAANNFRMLQPWEFAAVNSKVVGEANSAANGDPLGKTEALVRLADGQQFSFPRTTDSVTTILESQAGVSTFVREGEGVTIHGSASSEPSEKIDSRLKKVNKADESEIPVIIRFNLSYKHFYDKADRHAVAQFQKRQEFGNARNHVAAILKGAGRVKHDLLIINSVSATLKPAMLERLAEDTTVARIEPDITVHITLDTSVDEIHARETWQLSDGNNNPLTGVGKRIAIIDSGVDYTHPDLGGCLGANCKVTGGWNFLANNSNPMDDNGHGTHVAATAAGNGLLRGVAPDARILAYKVCNSGGSCSSSDIISAIDYATDPDRDGDFSDHVDVANMSLGGLGGNPDDAMSFAVDNSTFAGVVHTIAAGNDGPSPNTIGSPGTSRMAITVAAACKADQVGVDGRCTTPIASFSSRGPLIWNDENIQKPDVAAPGVMICAARWGSAFTGSPTCLDNQHVRISGTSMATPHVAGAAALVRQAFPSYSPEQVKQLLKNTARSLNRPYDEQGAGEIDLSAAIPGSNKVNASPNSWEMYTDPSIKLTQFDNFFDVAPIDPSISTLDISANIPVPGVSLNFDKTTLNVAGQTSDSFFATMIVDNDVARSGNYSGSIILSEGGVTKGIIPLYLHVAPTVRISPSPIVDYGVDNPSLASWTSENRPLTITNFRSDISQTFSIASSAYAAGITFNSPTSVTVPPEGVVTINTNFFVDNSVTPNGSYSGSLRVFNETAETSVTTKFTKFFTFTFNDSSGEIVGSTAVLHNRINMQSIFTVNANSTTIYLDTPGPYDLELYYPPRADASGTHNYTVIKEGISLAGGGTTIEVSRNDAVYQLKLNGTAPSGAPAGPLGLRDSWDQYIGKGFGVIRIGGSGTDTTTNYFSAVSTSYRHHEVYESNRQAAPVLNYYYGGFTGLNSNLTFTNTAADFKSLQLKVELNRETGTAQPLVFTCLPTLTTCFANSNTGSTLPVPVTQTINSLLPPNTYQYQISDSFKTGCPPSGACSSTFLTAYLDLASHSRKANVTDAVNLPTWDGDLTYNGLGPSFWVAKFANSGGFIRLQPYYGSLPTAFMRQDFALQDYDPVPYVLDRNGAPYSSGELGGVLATSFFPLLPSFGAPAGQYQFKIDSFPYVNHGISLNAKVKATFDTSLPDANPPALTQLKYTTAGARSDLHDSNATNQLFFAMDAVGGSLAQVTAGFSGDGNTFIPLTLSAGGGGYTATVPAVPFNKIAIRLTGVDSSSNSLEYTFELPAINPVADTEAPTTSITAPTNGQTVSGVVNVQASAQDNFGVTQVELYQDGNLIGTTNAAPYTFSWNTAAVSAGSHTLVSKAYDAGGNVGSSAPINVTVQHDAAPPTTSITAPSAGQIVNGNVVVQVNAQDNIGVTQVDLYQDGNLIGTTTNAPYTFNWNTDAVSEGSHTLVSRAYDAAGNTGNSAPVTVTVKHDIISPTTSIASPSNGQTVTGLVSVQVNAQDNVGVTKVELYQDNGLIGTKTTAPYTFSWDTDAITNGSHTLLSKAYDASGNTGGSSPVTVTVNHDPIPPTVALTAPVAGAILTGTVTVSADASDNKAVAKVEFYRNGVLLGTDTNAPYSIQWNTGAETPGSYTLTAKAYDTSNNTTTSAARNVTVQDSIAPTVSITSPANNATVTRRSIVTIAASATDNIGITRVEFYVQGSLTCTDTATPFTCAWTVPNIKGVFTLQARGYDAAGNIGTSSTISVTSK